MEAHWLEDDSMTRCGDCLDQAGMSFPLKDGIFEAIQSERSIPVLLGQMYAMELDKDLLGALLEILTACPVN